ncbi:nitroreductase family protein [Streptococcus halichoeri]|uniref:nitroreductase family protein n=1 Tax=Streptococcus halichoeri TaxID=254785 RepID=UPI00135CDD92|nr:nitroreductase family protein [Streptococcus halichoeri]
MSFKNNQFDDLLFGRRSIRSFDPQIKISKDEMLTMIDEAAKAPSSVNMQPWRLVIVESPEAKAKLKPLIRFNTLQNETSSAMILIFGDMRSQERAEEIYGKAVKENKMPEAVKQEQLAKIVPTYDNASREEMSHIVHIDASLLAMQLMLVARAHGYDTNAIGGFEKNQLAQAFDLDPERYVPVVIVAMGVAKDKGYDSVRLDAKDITKFY